jgi:predicted outer membrane protein
MMAPGAPIDSQTFRMMASQSDAFEIAAARLALERSRNPRVLAYAHQMMTDHGQTSQALNGGRPVYSATGTLVNPTSVTGTLAGAGVGALVGGPVGAAVGAGIGATTGAVASNVGAGPKPGYDPNFQGPLGSRSGLRSGSLATNPQPGGPEVGVTGSVAGTFETAVPLDAEKSAMLNQLATASGPQFDRLYGRSQWMAHGEALNLYRSYAMNGNDPALVTFAQSVIPHLEQHYAESRRLPGAGNRR